MGAEAHRLGCANRRHHHLIWPPLWFGLQSAYKVHQETGGLLVGVGSYLAFQLVVSGLIVAGAWWGTRRLQRMGKATVASLRKQAREGQEVLDSRAAELD